MKNVRIGILGLGVIGLSHASHLMAGRVPGLQLSAAADRTPSKGAHLPGVALFDSAEALVNSGLIDALLVCTPHFDHPESGVLALRAGLHLLLEKPIAVHKAAAERLLAAHKNPRQIFAAMFNQRSDPAYRRIRELVRGGALGEIRRISWTATDWFRPDAYYAASRWRATWAGEGGGVLLNQCPHHLDLLQWIFGMPRRLRADCGFGRYHDIEVEDDVNAFLQFPNGATGVFSASTGEAPGTSRVEAAGDLGRLVFEDGQLRLLFNEMPMNRFAREAREPFSKPATRAQAESFADKGGQHVEILRNFAAAIRGEEELIAPAREGLCSLELANAMLLSAWTSKTVDLPLGSARYARHLKAKMAVSRFVARPSAAPGPSPRSSA